MGQEERRTTFLMGSVGTAKEHDIERSPVASWKLLTQVLGNPGHYPPHSAQPDFGRI